VPAGLPHLVVAVLAAVAAANPDSGIKPVEVDFDAPEGCSSADAFFGFVRSRTSRVRRAEEHEPHTTLQVRLGRQHGQVQGELRMVDDLGGTETRKVQGGSCDEVVQALSLTAALALDPAALMGADATGSSGEVDSPSGAAGAASKDRSQESSRPPKPPEPEPERVATVAAEPSSAPPLPIPSFELAAGPVAMEVLSGQWSPGVLLAARKTFGKEGVFTPTLGLHVQYERNDVARSPGAAQVSFGGMGVTVCPLRLRARILTVQPCGLLVGGWLFASGRQTTVVDSATRFWLSAGATLRAAVSLGVGFSVELEGGLSAPFFKRRFWVSMPANVIAETPSISGIVGLALTYAW
jgi:hypothetical protein